MLVTLPLRPLFSPVAYCGRPLGRTACRSVRHRGWHRWPVTARFQCKQQVVSSSKLDTNLIHNPGCLFKSCSIGRCLWTGSLYFRFVIFRLLVFHISPAAICYAVSTKSRRTAGSHSVAFLAPKNDWALSRQKTCKRPGPLRP